MYRLCASLLEQPADAEDATQEVLLRVLDKARSFGGRSRFSTWVYRLTVNHCHNHRRQNRRRAHDSLALVEPDQQPSSDQPGPRETLQRAEERHQLRALLAQLRPDHRDVLTLREVEGLSYDEIAEVLQIPSGTVMSRLSRARAQLAQWLAPVDCRVGTER